MMPTSLKDTDNGQVSNSSRKLLFPTTSDNAAQGGVWLNSAEQSPTPLSLTIRQDHVHMHIEYPPSKSISDLVKRLKGRTSRLLQQEFPELQKRYWGNHFWAVGYGAWSTGNITEEMVAEYLEHHRNPSNQDNDNFLLE